MKKIAVLLILFGSGLAAFGISGFSGGLDTNTRGAEFGQPAQLEGSLGWDMNDRVEIAVGVLSLIGGLILRKDSK
jgi:uncharacterized membrane protein YphA (DoxX/SURF4 family)